MMEKWKNGIMSFLLIELISYNYSILFFSDGFVLLYINSEIWKNVTPVLYGV